MFSDIYLNSKHFFNTQYFSYNVTTWCLKSACLSLRLLSSFCKWKIWCKAYQVGALFLCFFLISKSLHAIMHVQHKIRCVSVAVAILDNVIKLIEKQTWKMSLRAVLVRKSRSTILQSFMLISSQCTILPHLPGQIMEATHQRHRCKGHWETSCPEDTV